jgi:hypothetical protein
MSISALRDRVRKELLEFSWSQWAQLGLSAHTTRSDRWAVDPEALIVFTAEVARRDPRLFDELLDWMSLNGRLLSLQRLRNLTGRFPLDRKLVEAVVAWVGESTPSLRWSKAGQQGSEGKGKGVPLFSQDVVSFLGEVDPTFSRHGYVRPRARRSHKSSEPDLRAPVSLAFQLRLVLGPGSRSEIMRVLLTAADGPLDAARIADEAGFAKRNVNETLSTLVVSGVVKARWSGNERVFLALRDKWSTLLELGPSADNMPTFVSWIHLLPVLVDVLAWLEREAETTDSAYLVSSRARDLMERVTLNLEIVGLAVPPRRSYPGAAYLPAFVETVESLLAMIGSES